MKSYKLRIIFLVGLLAISLFPFKVEARITPEDIVNAKKEAYEKNVVNYSQANQEKLKLFSEKIIEINKRRTSELERSMEVQARLLDEYERRFGEKDTEKARYWITFAHEAVAYQAAKIYVFDLSSEKNIKGDVLSTVNRFQYDLNYSRSTVIKSQKFLNDLVKTK